MNTYNKFNHHINLEMCSKVNKGFYSSFELDKVPFEALFLIIIPICIVLTFILIYIVSNTFQNIRNIFYFIIPIFIITFVFFFSPQIMLISSIILAAIILLVEFYPIRSKNDYRNDFYNHLWNIGILPFFIRLHSLVFYRSSSLTFLFLVFATYSLSFLYVVLSRYYLFYTVASPKLFSYFFLILVLIGIFNCLSAFVLRLLINISNLLVFNIQANNPSLWAHIVQMEPELSPDSVTPPKPIISKSFLSFHRHYHRYHIPPNRFSLWQKVGFTAGVCTLAVGCITAYYSYNAYLQSVRSADAAVLSANAAQQAVDLAEVGQGIRSRESYDLKYPDSSRIAKDSNSTSSNSPFEDTFDTINYPYDYFDSNLLYDIRYVLADTVIICSYIFILISLYYYIKIHNNK